MIAGSSHKIIVGTDGYILSVDDIFIPGSYTNVIFPSQSNGYVFNFDDCSHTYTGKVNIRVDKSKPIMTSTVVTIIAINADNDQVSCNLHLTYMDKEQLSLQTKSSENEIFNEYSSAKYVTRSD